MTPEEARAVTALETYYRLECRTLAGTWIAYESNTTDQGWTPVLHYVEAQLEEALDGCPEDSGQYRIVTQLRGPITAYTAMESADAVD